MFYGLQIPCTEVRYHDFFSLEKPEQSPVPLPSNYSLWVNAPTLQADVSSLSDPYDDYILDVTAVLGANESDNAPPDGIIFSYFMSSPAELKCELCFQLLKNSLCYL